MGRKSIVRRRKDLTPKTKLWVRNLLPLLQDQELDKLTLDELALLMNKSKSTIYSYFSTKEEIYLTAVRLVLEDMSFIISPEALKGKDMEVVLRQMMFAISQGIEGISISFLEQIQSHFPLVWQEIQDFTEKLLGNFEKIYAEGMRNGVFNQFNLKLLLALDRYFIISIMTDNAQFQAQKMSLNDLVQEYLELRLKALLNN